MGAAGSRIGQDLRGNDVTRPPGGGARLSSWGARATLRTAQNSGGEGRLLYKQGNGDERGHLRPRWMGASQAARSVHTP